MYRQPHCRIGQYGQELNKRQQTVLLSEGRTVELKSFNENGKVGQTTIQSVLGAQEVHANEMILPRLTLNEQKIYSMEFSSK
jgi:hypothetical protein